ncbi:hypothetical protein BC940DRAFT_130446 [Gongronella butleri]|nr:hypothetical protein BC940DRAFT_130446 [Gongronella butleri]
MVRLFSLRPMRFAWIAACLHATYAQTSDFDTSVDQFPVKTTIDQDVKPLFSVEYHNWYKVVTNHAVNQKYALVCCGQTLESDLYDAVVPVPVQSVGVDGALPVLPFLDLLGQQDVVHFIHGIANVTSPCYDTVEKDDGDADVVFLSRQAPPRARRRRAPMASSLVPPIPN